MPIRADDGGSLGLNEVMSSVGGQAGTRTDMIGIGTLIGATDGSEGDDVVLPDNFWGQDVILNINSLTASPNSKSLSNAGQSFTSTFTVNPSAGSGRIEMAGGITWIFAQTTFFQASGGYYTMTFQVDANNALGTTSRSGTINILGASNVLKDTISVTQAGNPATLTVNNGVNPIEFGKHTDTTINYTIVTSTNVTLTSSTSGDSDFTTEYVSGTGTSQTYRVNNTPDFDTSPHSFTLTTVATATDGSGQTMTDTKTVYLLGYDTLAINTYSIGPTCNGPVGATITFDADGETKNYIICGEAGTTWTLSNTNSDFTISPTSGTTNSTTFTITAGANTEGATRTSSVAITDNNGQTGEKTYTLSQAAQPITDFSVTPTSLTWDNDDTSVKTVSVTISAASGFSDDVDAYHTHGYTTSDEFQHSWTNSSFVSYEQNITSTTGGNRTYYIKPSAVNNSITNEISNNYLRIRAADYSTDYFQPITLTHKAAPIQMRYYHRHSYQTSIGMSSSNAIGMSTSSITIRVFSTTNDSSLGLKFQSYSSIQFSVAFSPSNPYPSSGWYYPSWSYDSSSGHYYFDIYFNSTGSGCSFGYYTIVSITQNITVNQIKYGTTMTDLTTYTGPQGWYACS